MVRVALLAMILGCASLASTFAQSSAPTSPSIELSPTSGGLTTSYHAHAADLPANASVVIALFDPSGNQTIMHALADASGSLDETLAPPGGAWQIGLYRIAIGFGEGQSISATFAAGDGQPHLFADPSLPSPTSAFNLVGIGFAPNTVVDLVLSLTGGQEGQKEISAATNADGSFSLYVWPQQFGFPFFAAGQYKLAAPNLGLSVDFTVREHPMSAAISVDGPVLPDSSVGLHFQHYARGGRYLWGIYAGGNGQVAGEFLVGPTDQRGDIDVPLRFSGLTPGQYLLATPYDWGETAFTVIDPTSTPTPTAMPTPPPDPTPAATPKPKATARPKTARTSTHRCTKGNKRKCSSKAKHPAPSRAKQPTPVPWKP